MYCSLHAVTANLNEVDWDSWSTFCCYWVWNVFSYSAHCSVSFYLKFREPWRKIVSGGMNWNVFCILRGHFSGAGDWFFNYWLQSCGRIIHFVTLYWKKEEKLTEIHFWNCPLIEFWMSVVGCWCFHWLIV